MCVFVCFVILADLVAVLVVCVFTCVFVCVRLGYLNLVALFVSFSVRCVFMLVCVV